MENPLCWLCHVFFGETLNLFFLWERRLSTGEKKTWCPVSCLFSLKQSNNHKRDYHLVICYIAMEAMALIEIDGLPINSMVIFHG